LGIIPFTFGVSANRIPPGNVGETNNRGYEMILGWNDRAGELSYNIEGSMSYARNRIIYRAEAKNPYEWMNETGHSIGQRFGFKSDGCFNTVEELNQRPTNSGISNNVTLGDIRYLDLNGDGFIDNKDMAPIGYPNRPEYQYSVKMGVSYRGFDLRLLFNGTAHGSFYIDNAIALPFFKNAGNAFQWQYDGRWTPEKAASGAEVTYPRATYGASTGDHNFQRSDFWIRPNDFFKLKNAEIGYTFPASKGFMKAAGISSLRLYASGNNIYTFVNHLKDLGVDPEMRDEASYLFPLTRTFVFGFNIQF
jgi:hypothetical protein